MAKAFDGLSKGILGVALEVRGELEIEKEVRSEAQTMDAVFAPALPWINPPELGLLGRIASKRCAFEVEHNTPTIQTVQQCLRRQLTWWHQLNLDAQKRTPACHIPLPTVWVLTTGRPVAVLADLACVPMESWPRGIYMAPVGIGLRVVVLSEFTQRPRHATAATHGTRNDA